MRHKRAFGDQPENQTRVISSLEKLIRERKKVFHSKLHAELLAHYTVKTKKPTSSTSEESDYNMEEITLPHLKDRSNSSLQS